MADVLKSTPVAVSRQAQDLRLRAARLRQAASAAAPSARQAFEDMAADYERRAAAAAKWSGEG